MTQLLMSAIAVIKQESQNPDSVNTVNPKGAIPMKGKKEPMKKKDNDKGKKKCLS